MNMLEEILKKKIERKIDALEESIRYQINAKCDILSELKTVQYLIFLTKSQAEQTIPENP